MKSNILIDSNHTARIADFGLTSVLRHPSISISVTAPAWGGTPQWMAPELFDGESSPSRESDIYALGMVIYEVRIAFSGESVLKPKDCTCRFSHTNDHSPVFTLILYPCWSSKTNDPRGHRTERFLGSRKMSGSWRKSAGTETRASGHTSQTFCRTLRQLLAVGSPRLPKRSRVSALTAQQPKTLRRENQLLQHQRLCGGDDRTGSGDRNLAVSPHEAWRPLPMSNGAEWLVAISDFRSVL